MPSQDGIEIRWIFSVIRRWIWLILGCTLISASVAFVVITYRPPVYQASETLLVEPARDIQTNDYSAIMTGERLALTYSQMLIGQQVLQEVINGLKINETPDQLTKRITVEPIQNTQLIRLSVKDSSPEKAALIVNALSEALITQIRALQVVRYTSSLSGMQVKLDELLAQIKETQLKIDLNRSQKTSIDSRLTNLQNPLAEYRINNRALQQDYHNLQLTVAQLTDRVKVSESAQSQYKPPNKYSATTTLFFDEKDLATTYGKMIAGKSVLEAALSKLGLHESADDLAKRVFIQSVPGTQLIRLTVEDREAAKARNLADAIAEAFVTQFKSMLAAPYSISLANLKTQIEESSQNIDSIQTEIEDLTTEKIQVETELTKLEDQLVKQNSDSQSLQKDIEQVRLSAAQAADVVVIAEPARIPEKPIDQRFLFTILAGLVGLVIGGGIAFLLEHLNDTFDTPGDIQKVLEINNLGTIGRLSKRDRGLIVMTQPRSPIAEAFRRLAINLRFSNPDKPIHTLLVTSPHPLEGKSTIVANLAVALAQAELTVIAVDADLRLPRLHQLFGLELDPGLTSSLRIDELDGNLRSTQVDRLKVLTGGEIPENPTEIVSSSQMHNLLESLSQKADMVIIDSPPVLVAADARALAATVDGVLLVLKAGSTRIRWTMEAIESLRQVNANLVGVVLNSVSDRQNGYYYYYRYYGERKAERKSIQKSSNANNHQER